MKEGSRTSEILTNEVWDVVQETTLSLLDYVFGLLYVYT